MKKERSGDRRRRHLVNRLQTNVVVIQLCWTAAMVTVFACLVFGASAYDVFAGRLDRQERAASRDDIMRASDGGFIGLGRDY